MSATITSNVVNAPANLRIVKLKIVCDAAYPTGGYDISTAIQAAGIVNLGNAYFGLAQVRHLAAAQLVAVVRPDVNKVSLFESSTGAPLALVECAASSAHVTASTIIDVILFFVDTVTTTV